MNPPRLDLGALSLYRGGSLLLHHALAQHPVVEVCGTSPGLAGQLQAWCRVQGHRLEVTLPGLLVRRRSRAPAAREPAGPVQAPAALADPRWGCAPRGALLEGGGPTFDFRLRARDGLWSARSPALLEQALNSVWDVNRDLDWATPPGLEDGQEQAVAQLMTWLAEATHTRMMLHARVLGQVHPHLRETTQLLALQLADEARHLEAFTRRAHHGGAGPGRCSPSQMIHSRVLFEEPDAICLIFVLDVIANGGFVPLLALLAEEGPDPLTRALAGRVGVDLARHQGVALAWLGEAEDPALLDRLEEALRRLHLAVRDQSGLSEESFDALTLLCAGSWDPAAIGRGFDRVVQLYTQMDRARQASLGALGFGTERAAALAALHTRNFL